MLIATDFIILRDVTACGRTSIPLDRKPHRVATLIDEKLFVESGHEVSHFRTVFLEDYVHDWEWAKGSFRYYSRVAEKADVLIIYAEKHVADKIKYCSACGKPSETVICTECEKKS